MSKIYEKVLTEPSVIAIAQTVMDYQAVEQWAGDHGYGELLGGTDSPLGKIHNTLKHGSDQVEPGDLLPEFAGRFCYRSMKAGRETPDYIRNILEQGHGSVMEHSSITFAISGVSRSFSHELVRHRAGAAISQESQRYVDADDILFVAPPLLLDVWGSLDCTEAQEWLADQEASLGSYRKWQEYLTQVLIRDGEGSKVELKKRINEAARASLPNCAETRLVWTANYRTLRHVIELRGSDHADLEIRRWAGVLLKAVEKVAPHFFLDMDEKEMTKQSFGVPSLECVFSKV